MAALKLPMSALLDDRDLTPSQRGKAAQRRREREAELSAVRALDRAERSQLFKLERLMNALGAKLAANPEDMELGMLFHRACDRLHEAETKANEKQRAHNELLEKTA